MAGLYDRLAGSDNSLPVHFIHAAVTLHAEEPTIFTKVHLRNRANARLGDSPLTTAEEADLDGIMDEMDVQSNITAKMRYADKVWAVNYAVAGGDLTSETVWRNQLGL
jgi:hypothetical protein